MTGYRINWSFYSWCAPYPRSKSTSQRSSTILKKSFSGLGPLALKQVSHMVQGNCTGINSRKKGKGKYHQKQAAMRLKWKACTLNWKLASWCLPGLARQWTHGERKFIISWSRTQLTQLELFAGLAWILSDPTSINRPRIDHWGIREPAGSGRPRDEPKARTK